MANPQVAYNNLGIFNYYVIFHLRYVMYTILGIVLYRGKIMSRQEVLEYKIAFSAACDRVNNQIGENIFSSTYLTAIVVRFGGNDQIHYASFGGKPEDRDKTPDQYIADASKGRSSDPRARIAKKNLRGGFQVHVLIANSNKEPLHHDLSGLANRIAELMVRELEA